MIKDRLMMKYFCDTLMSSKKYIQSKKDCNCINRYYFTEGKSFRLEMAKGLIIRMKQEG